MLFGEERITLTSRGIEATHTMLGFGKTRFYPTAAIKDVRLAPEAIAWHGALLFDSDSETVRLAAGLDYAEAKSLLRQLFDAQIIKMAEP